MFCFRCKHLSPPGSAYCAYCPGRKSFNGIVCGGGHRCSVGTRTCPTCGNEEFSEHTWGFRTDWIAQVATVALLIALWKVGLAHYARILSLAGNGAAVAVGILTNTNSQTLGFALQTGLFYLCMAWLLGMWLSIMPGGGGAVGKFLRGIPGFLCHQILRAIPRLLRLLWTGTLRLSGLAPGKSAPVASKPKGKSAKGDDL